MTKTSQWPVPPDSIRYVIPDPVIRGLSRHPLTRDLYPLAFGHYRRAAGHHMHREHHNDDLLIHCTEGEAYLNVEDEPCLIRAGDLVLIPAGAAHRYTAATGEPMDNSLGALCRPIGGTLSGTHGIYRRHPRSAHRSATPIAGGLQRPAFGTADRFPHPGLVHVANRLRQLLAAVPLSVGEAGQAQQPDLDIIHNFMREHLDERITLNQLADLTGLSPAHFATRYRALTGVSPIQHFLHLKVEQACQLLDTTDHSFTQISSLLGYDDNYYFSRLFKKVMGQSPTDYRHTHRH